MSETLRILLARSLWADEMRRRYPLEIVPTCEDHGEAKVRASRGWRCRSCHRERTRAYRARVTA